MSNKTKPKPRVMWAVYFGNSKQWLTCHKTKAEAECYRWSNTSDEIHRVAVIPLDDVEAIVERLAKAMALQAGYTGSEWSGFSQELADVYRLQARAALTAAGIPCKQRRARK